MRGRIKFVFGLLVFSALLFSCSDSISSGTITFRLPENPDESSSRGTYKQSDIEYYTMVCIPMFSREDAGKDGFSFFESRNNYYETFGKKYRCYEKLKPGSVVEISDIEPGRYYIWIAGCKENPQKNSVQSMLGFGWNEIPVCYGEARNVVVRENHETEVSIKMILLEN